MAPKANLTMSANIEVRAREIDFVTRFGDTWESLREILSVMRMIRKENGTVLKTKKASIVLQDGKVGEGEEIPYSLANVEETPYGEITIEKYAKAVSIEAVDEHGAEAAINMTDEAFLNELQGNILERFYAHLATGTLTSNEATFQMAVAMAIGKVKDKFKKMRKNHSKIVVWVNTLDAYKYLGAAELTVQSAFGIDYVENFMGADKMILSSEIAEGKVIATPVDNIICYYVDPSNSGFRKLGLEYTVSGETPLIGFHANGNYNTAVGESFALMGLTLLTEYIDAIAVVSITGA
jgi:hypothetical protein